MQILKYNGNPIGLQLPPHVELTVTYTEPAVRGDTSSGSVTKAATLETGLEIRVPLFVKEGDRVKVHTETREFVGSSQLLTSFCSLDLLLSNMRCATLVLEPNRRGAGWRNETCSKAPWR